MTMIARTGKMVPFLDIGIGSPFWAHDRVWVRTSHEAATELIDTPIRSEGKIRHASACDFTIDEIDREVEAVEIRAA